MSEMFGITRSEKRGSGDIRGLQIENNRDASHPVKLVRSKVDWSKTPLNVYLEKSPDFKTSIEKICSEHNVKIRKNSVVSIDTLFSASAEFFETTSKETQIAYFKDCFEFAKQNLGEVYNFVIHFDEDATPHAHCMSVPIVEREDGRFSLSARDLMGGPVDYRKRQDLFYEEVSKKYGLERGNIEDDVEKKKKHLDTLDYREKMAEERVALLEGKVETLQREKDGLTEKIEMIRTVEPLLTRIYQKISMVADHMISAVERCFSIILNKIENCIPITRSLVHRAGCDMEEIPGTDLYTPTMADGSRLEYFQENEIKVSPAYIKEAAEDYMSDVFTPSGSVTNENEIKEIADAEEWKNAFPEGCLDDDRLPFIQDVMNDVFNDYYDISDAVKTVLHDVESDTQSNDTEKAQEIDERHEIDIDDPDPFAIDPDDDNDDQDDWDPVGV